MVNIYNSSMGPVFQAWSRGPTHLEFETSETPFHKGRAQDQQLGGASPGSDAGPGAWLPQPRSHPVHTGLRANRRVEPPLVPTDTTDPQNGRTDAPFTQTGCRGRD